MREERTLQNDGASIGELTGELPGSESASDGAAPEATLTKTGTTTVALVADGGVVLAADRRASLGGRLVSNKNVRKVEQVHPAAAATMAGSVGGLQSFVRTLRAEARLYETRRGSPMSVDALATFGGTLLRRGPYRLTQPILAGVDDGGPCAYELDAGGAVMETACAARGSGMGLAYGVLEREHDPEATLEEARAVAARAVASAVERDTASGNGLTLAAVTGDGVRIDAFDDAGEVAA